MAGDQFGTPPTPDHKYHAVTEAFGWQTSDEVPPSVQLGIQNAYLTQGALQSTISQGITNQWANAAVTTHILQGKIGYAVAGGLQQAQTAAAQLQNPVAMSVVGPLGTAVEATLPLGTVPPMPGDAYQAPACVQIVEGAKAGDLTPALEAYRLTAWPQRFIRGIQYADAVNFILNCMSGYPAMQESFSATVLDLQNLPASCTDFPCDAGGAMGPPGGQPGGIGQLPPVSGPPGGIGPLPGIRQMSPVGSASLQAGVVPMPAGLPPGVPVRQAGPAVGIGPLPPVQQVPPGGAPGGGAAMPPGAPDQGSIVTIPAPAGFGGYEFPVCGVIQGAPVEDAQRHYPTGTWGGGTRPYSYTVTWIQGPGVDEWTMVAQEIGPANPNFGPPMTCTASWGTPVPGPPPGAPPLPPVPTPPGPTPPQPTPTPPKPPPPPPPKDCIKICPDEKPPPEPCKTPAYDVYCSAQSALLYVVKRGDQPRYPGDRLIGGGQCNEINWSQLLAQCQGSTGGTQPELPPVIAAAPFMGGCADFPPAPVANAGNGLVNLAQWLGIVGADGQPYQPFPNAGVTDIGQNLVNSFFQLLGQPLVIFLNAVQQIIAGSGCADGTQTNLIATEALIQFAQRFVGSSLDQMSMPLGYQRHYRCPVQLPTSAEAASAWLGNEIDDGTFECWVRANNGRFPEYTTFARSQRTKLAGLQYATLKMRGYLNDQDYNLRLRASGWLQATDHDDLLNLMKQIPPASDLVRFMVRDAGDEQLVQQFNLDADFGKKFSQQIQDWSEAQGVDPLYMKYIWRAHWSIPSPTQLFEMLHRNSRLPQGDPAFVDIDTIRAALEQQDIAPFWIDKFIATSYRPLTRIDASRAYKIGALNYADLVNAYLDLGYNSSNAERLAKFQSLSADLSFQKHWTVKAYSEGAITSDEMDSALRTDGATDAGVQYARNRAQTELSASTRRACTRAYHKRFLLGDISLSDVQSELLAIGLEPDQSDALTRGWVCERDSRAKLIPAGQLCSLYEQGALSISELTQRLQRIGYTYDDSILLARRCATITQQRITKQEQAALKQQQAQDAKQAKALARSAAQEARAVRQGQQMAAQNAKIAIAREKRLIEAGEKFSKHFAGSLPDAIIAVKAMYREILSKSLYTQDEIINALVVVTGSSEVFDIPSLTVAMQAALAA